MRSIEHGLVAPCTTKLLGNHRAKVFCDTAEETCEYVFDQSAMQNIQIVSAKLAKFSAGEQVPKAKLQQLMGEFKANSAVIDAELERGDETSR